MKSQIASILSEPNVRSRILNSRDFFVHWYTRRRNAEPQTPEAKGGEFDDLQQRAIDEWLLQLSVDSTLNDDIVKRISSPIVVTERDVRSAMHRFYASAAHLGQWEYEDFVRYLDNVANSPRVSCPIAVGTCTYRESIQDFQFLVWKNARGFSVTIVGSLPLHEEHNEFDWPSIGEGVCATRRVYVRLTGCGSRRAFKRFGTTVTAVMRMCISAVRELNRLQGIEAFSPVALPYGLFGQVLEAYFSQSSRKDSIDRRIRNAVHLLVESHRQRHDAIGLSLSLSAIEALLCDKTEGIAKQLAENVAVLLEPDSRARGDAISFTKALYDARSKTLHGARLEHERDDRRRAWVLAFGTLRAILQRQEFQRKAGVDVEAPQELFKELYDSMLTGGEIPGVQHSPVRRLWNENLSDVEVEKSLRDLRNWAQAPDSDDDGDS